MSNATLHLPNRTRVRTESEPSLACVRKRPRSGSHETILNPKRERLDTFEHAPLDLDASSIRLVQVLSSDPKDDLIRCHVRHATIDANYICLSYVWGPADDYHTILIDDRPFRVRRNLWDFLRTNDSIAFHFEQPLWIDAICIDQNNTSERNHQVQQMGKIYGSAQNVIAWMGDEPVLASLFRGIRTEWHHGRLIPPDKFRKGIPDLSKNEYWTRAWITQEITLAKHVYLLAGEEAVGLTDFDSAVVHNSTHDAVIASYTRFGLDLPWRPSLDMKSRDVEHTLLEYLWISRSKQCSDPRDKIYSLLSMARDAVDIQVDYAIQTIQLALNILNRY
ncbi:HET-domain-containing protein, partial [Dothidotthia symphoricarpi CBS 119687]